MSSKTDADWRSTCCVLCTNNCGLRVQVENDRITKVKADRDTRFGFMAYGVRLGLFTDGAEK